MNQNITGTRIRELRENHKPKKMSQAALAKKLGYEDGNTVLYWENGRSEVPNEKLSEIADIFRVDINYLLGNIDTPNLSISQHAEYIDRLAAYGNSYLEYLHQLGYDVNYEQIDKYLDKARNNDFCNEYTLKPVYNITITYPDGSTIQTNEAEMDILEKEIKDFTIFKLENLKK